jgi:hypothetical protein
MLERSNGRVVITLANHMDPTSSPNAFCARARRCQIRLAAGESRQNHYGRNQVPASCHSFGADLLAHCTNESVTRTQCHVLPRVQASWPKAQPSDSRWDGPQPSLPANPANSRTYPG